MQGKGTSEYRANEALRKLNDAFDYMEFGFSTWHNARRSGRTLYYLYCVEPESVDKYRTTYRLLPDGGPSKHKIGDAMTIQELEAAVQVCRSIKASENAWQALEAK